MNDTTQGSEAWRQARCGKATASRISDIIAKTKTGWGASRDNYLSELVAERLTGVPIEGYKSASMERGSQMEADAKTAYEFRASEEIEPVGFVQHPTLEWSGASPDGLIGTLGIVEFKCPELRTHIDYLLGGTLSKAYRCQMQWELECTGRLWCDFVSYNPLLPPEMRLHIRRIRIGSEEHAELIREVPAFLGEVENRLTELRQRFLVKSLAEQFRGSL